MIAPRTVRVPPRRHSARSRPGAVLAVVMVSGALSMTSFWLSDDPTLSDGAARATAAPRLQDHVHGSPEVDPPDLREDVQRWMVARDRPLVRLNNALVPIVLGTMRDVGARSPGCRRLDASVLALQRVGHAPDSGVDVLAAAGLDEIQQAARACLDGDLQRARRLARNGLDARAEASLELDEALEGE